MSPESALLNAVIASVPPVGTLELVGTTLGSISLRIGEPPHNGGESLDLYRIFESTDVATWDYSPAAAAANQTNLTDLVWTRLGCTVGQNYFFRLRYVNGAGEGELTPLLRVRCSLGPAQPDSPTLFDSTKTSIAIEYEAAELHGGTLAGFTLYIDDGNGGPFVSTFVEGATNTRFNFTDLIPGMPYRLRVQVHTDAGVSPVSDILHTYSGNRADAVTDIYVSSSTTNSITLAWNLGVSYSSGGASVIRWYVYSTPDRDYYPPMVFPNLATEGPDDRTVTYECLCFWSERSAYSSSCGLCIVIVTFMHHYYCLFPQKFSCGYDVLVQLLRSSHYRIVSCASCIHFIISIFCREQKNRNDRQHHKS